MTSAPARLALLHGQRELADGLAARLQAAGLFLREVADQKAVQDALTSADVSLLLVDHRAVAGIAAASAGSTPAGRSAAPLLALGCPDGEAAAAALAAGATMAVRADAGPDEAWSLVQACVAGTELSRDFERTREDLRRHVTLVIKDDLTSAFNRRYFDRQLEEEIAQARAASVPLSLIFMDVDDLKVVNKRHGHAVGSTVLREVAARTIVTVADSGRVVRYGGDEFCIVVPRSSAPEAVALAGRIRESFARAPFAVEGTGGVELTASFGIAAFPEHAVGADALVQAADWAMLRSKEQRKNGILVASCPTPGLST